MAQGVKRTVTEVRSCLRCGDEFQRNPKYSIKQWDGARWCSRKCSTWNRGLTKHDDPRLMAISNIVRIAATGRPGWSKGLTKHTHPSLAVVARKVSEIQKGRPCTEAQRTAMSIGWNWATGRTSENCPNIAAGAIKRADKLRGRKNPEHSVRMKTLYAANPEKHPNAILAKKTKGRGFTHIEKIAADILRDLCVEYKYNVRIGSKWPDFSIASHMLIVEADGEHWHQDAVKEAARDAHLQALGWEVLHLTGKQLVNDMEGCRASVAAALERRDVQR